MDHSCLFFSTFEVVSEVVSEVVFIHFTIRIFHLHCFNSQVNTVDYPDIIWIVLPTNLINVLLRVNSSNDFIVMFTPCILDFVSSCDTISNQYKCSRF